MSVLKLLPESLLNRRFIFSYLITVILLWLMYKINYFNNLRFGVFIILLFSALYLAKKQKFDPFVFGILGGIVSIVIKYRILNFYFTFFDIHEWDFLALYIYGKAAADGLAFYDPSSFTNILSTINVPFKVTKDFYDSIILVGCDYPPTSMILFAPLGLLSLKTALAVWRILILSFLVTDIFLIFKIFRTHENKWVHLLIVISLMLIMQSTEQTLYYCQTNFFLLFFILLAYRNMANWKSGMFLALAVVIKPIAAFMSLYFLINRKWKPLQSLILTGIILILISISAFGMNNFITFFISPPTLRIPQDWYLDSYNQSLYAFLYRLKIDNSMEFLSANISKIYIAASLLLTSLTCIASYKLAKSNIKASFLIFLPLSLLIYPLFWQHYAVILLPVFFEFISKRNTTNLLFILMYIFALAFSGFAACLIILATFIIYSYLNVPLFTIIKMKSVSLQ